MEKARRCPLEVLFRSILYDAVDNVYTIMVCDGEEGRQLDPKSIASLLPSLRKWERGSKHSTKHPATAPCKTALIHRAAVWITSCSGWSKIRCQKGKKAALTSARSPETLLGPVSQTPPPAPQGVLHGSWL